MHSAQNPQYWRELNPYLTIDGKITRESAPIILDREVVQDLEDRLMNEGYFQTEPILPVAELVTLRESVEKIKQAD